MGTGHTQHCVDAYYGRHPLSSAGDLIELASIFLSRLAYEIGQAPDCETNETIRSELPTLTAAS
jgi:hypothetical protein